MEPGPPGSGMETFLRFLQHPTLRVAQTLDCLMNRMGWGLVGLTRIAGQTVLMFCYWLWGRTISDRTLLAVILAVVERVGTVVYFEHTKRLA